MVRLLPCGHRFESGNSLSASGGKAAYVYPLQTPFCLKMATRVVVFFPCRKLEFEPNKQKQNNMKERLSKKLCTSCSRKSF